MGHGVIFELAQAIAALKPRLALAVGPDANRYFEDYLQAHPDCTLTHLQQADDLSQIDTLGQFDVVVMQGVLEHLPKQQACSLISRLRDQHTQKLYVVVPMGKAWLNHLSHWSENDLIAFGMDKINVYAEQGRPLALYCFDLKTYKTTPEWFNSKYWARPELWDKH